MAPFLLRTMSGGIIRQQKLYPEGRRQQYDIREETLRCHQRVLTT